jgi:hypothetical protein
MRCTMPTSSLRLCTREGRYLYILDVGEVHDVIGAYCAQHNRAAGHSAMLRPRPWEYDRIFDAVAGINLID